MPDSALLISSDRFWSHDGVFKNLAVGTEDLVLDDVDSQDLALDDVNSQDLAGSGQFDPGRGEGGSLSRREAPDDTWTGKGFAHVHLKHLDIVETFDFLGWVVFVDQEVGHEARALPESVSTRRVGSVLTRLESARRCHIGRGCCFSTGSKVRPDLKPHGQTTSADEAFDRPNGHHGPQRTEMQIGHVTILDPGTARVATVGRPQGWPSA